MVNLVVDDSVNKTDLSAFVKYTVQPGAPQWFVEQTPSCYKLYAHLSKQLPDGALVADLGTNYGNSAIAFASNPNIKVQTYDILDKVGDGIGYRLMKNIRFVRADCALYIDAYINASLVLLDIDPHNGSDETKIVQALQNKGFKGVLLCDDIYYANMRSFWDQVTLKKFDLTKWGHVAGTGAIIFDSSTVNLTI